MISTRSGSIWNHSGRYRYRSQRGGRSQREAEITEAEIIEGMISNLEDLDLNLEDLDLKTRIKIKIKSKINRRHVKTCACLSSCITEEGKYER